MLPNLPTYIPLVFLLCAIVTYIYLYLLLKKSTLNRTSISAIIGIITIWISLQLFLAFNQFYSTNTMTTPSKFVLVIIPVALVLIWVFSSKKGKAFVDTLPLLPITYFNIIRIPIEICLYWLFINNTIPELMTFAGRNFDILAGLTAPFIAYFGLQKQQLSKNWILLWHFISLGLLFNIIVNALLSAPTVFQQFAFEQPNIAVAYFPFIWLPAFIVPVVLFGHFVAIRRLSQK